MSTFLRAYPGVLGEFTLLKTRWNGPVRCRIYKSVNDSIYAVESKHVRGYENIMFYSERKFELFIEEHPNLSSKIFENEYPINH